MYGPYVRSPKLLAKIDVGGNGVKGISILDHRIYVLCDKSAVIQVFQSKAPYYHIKPIVLKGLGLLCDLAACKLNWRLYIGDSDNDCIWCLDPDSENVCGRINGVPWPSQIFVTQKGHLVTVNDYMELKVFTSTRETLHKWNISELATPWFALENELGRMVKSHGNNEKFDSCHCICEVVWDGKVSRIIRSFGGAPGYGPKNINELRHMAVGKGGWILVVDSENGRVICLNPKLQFCQDLVVSDNHGPTKPFRICFSDDGCLYVGDRYSNQLCVFKIAQEQIRRSGKL